MRISPKGRSCEGIDNSQKRKGEEVARRKEKKLPKRRWDTAPVFRTEMSSNVELPLEAHCNLNRNFLSAIGLWAYDSLKIRRLRFTLFLLILISFTGIQVHSRITLNLYRSRHVVRCARRFKYKTSAQNRWASLSRCFQLIKIFVSEFNVNVLLKVLRLDIFFIAMSLKYVTFYVVAEKVSSASEFIFIFIGNACETDAREITFVTLIGR